MAKQGPLVRTSAEPVSPLGDIPSFWYLADLLDSTTTGRHPRGAIQDPVTLAFLVAASGELRAGPWQFDHPPILPSLFLERMLSKAGEMGFRRSCLELRRFSRLRQRIRVLAGISWQLGSRFPNTNKEVLWNASILSSLGQVLFANLNGSMALDQETLAGSSGGDAETDPAFQQASHLARDFCLKWNLPDWCLLWVTRMGWPSIIASIDGNQATEWHLARIASHLEARGEPTLNGVSHEGFLDSCKATGMDPGGPWRDGVVQRALEAFPENDSPSGDYPETDARWVGIALGQALSKATDGEARLSIHMAHERELAVRTMEQMHRELGRLTFERVMTGMAEFAAGAGHEINNPLAIIQGRARQLHRSAESLVKKPGLSEFRTRLEDIQAQCRRLHALLRKLMRFARPGKPVLSPMAASEIVGKLAESSRSWVDGAKLEGPAGNEWNPMEIHLIDMEKLGEAWAELCRNAAFAAGTHGTVSMRANRASDGRLEIRLVNSGPPIPDEIRNDLFTPFFSSRQAGRAPGLGLPLAWRLLDSIRARLTLESDGKGQPVCWKVEIPAADWGAKAQDGPEIRPMLNAA